MTKARFGLVTQSLFYLASGLNHFLHKAFYLHIMPDHYSHPAALVQLSGEAEIVAGLGLLFPATRRVSAAGIVVMLVLFLDVHQYMLRHADRFPEVSRWVLWLRIPLQFVLIAWAGRYARRDETGKALPAAAAKQAL